MGNLGIFGFSSGYLGMNIFGNTGAAVPDVFMDYNLLYVNATEIITVLRGGFVDFLLVGGGGGSGAGYTGVAYPAGGGGAEPIYRKGIYLPPGVYNVVIGSQKAQVGNATYGLNGDSSLFLDYVARGGKGAGNGTTWGQGGNSANGLYIGGSRSGTPSGGGAGDSGNGAGGAVGSGGIGTPFDITGILKYYCGGGKGLNGVNGLGTGPNTGGGGAYGLSSNAGVLILRWLTKGI